MPGFLTAHLADLVILAALALVMALAVRSIVRAGKAVKSSCGCDCARCASCGSCAAAKRQRENRPGQTGSPVKKP